MGMNRRGRRWRRGRWGAWCRGRRTAGSGSGRLPRWRRRGPCGVERAEAGEGLGDPARPVLHVDDDVVVAGEGGELGEGGREGEEEEAVEGVPGGEAGPMKERKP